MLLIVLAGNKSKSLARLNFGLKLASNNLYRRERGVEMTTLI